MPTIDELRILQNLDINTKIMKTKLRIKEWYEYWGGDVYISFSGGKDSTVLLHLVRELYPDVPAVFSDTGLEYPEIREFVKTIDNVTWLRPTKNFKKVVEENGYPILSKEHSFRIRKLKHMNLKPEYRAQQMERLGKWKILLNAPFECSEQCCEYLKKKPFKQYEKETGRKMFTGEMADDGMGRHQQYIKNGCNAFDLGRPKSTPIGFWKEQDVWDYINRFKVPYSKIYDMGETRTGCMFCAFGVHLEGYPNRFQRMQKTHPKQYDYCINKLGLKQVLEFINIQYEDNQITIDDLLK